MSATNIIHSTLHPQTKPMMNSFHDQAATACVKSLRAALVLLLFTTAAIAQPNLVQFSVNNFPEGTMEVDSNTMESALFETEDFEKVNVNPFNVLFDIIAAGSADRLEAAIAAAQISGTSEADVLDVAIESLSDADKLILGGAAFGVLYINLIDPFMSAELKFVNPTEEPLDITVFSTQGTIPIAIDTPLMLETLLTAELMDTGGDGAASASSVFLSYGRTLSDVTGPNENNTTTSEIALDGFTNLTDGVVAMDGTGPSNLSVSNLDIDFFDTLGVPVEDRGTISLSTFLTIEDLSPGDSITIRYAYSVGTDDHSVPFFPAEALIAALEEGIFLVPEPSSAGLILSLGLVFGTLHRRRS